MPARPLTTVTREDCERLYAALLALGARGAEHAVPRRIVLAETAWADRRLRHVMAAAPSFGVALGSSEDGYYVIARPEDANRAIAGLSSRIGELSRRRYALAQIRFDYGDGRLF